MVAYIAILLTKNTFELEDGAQVGDTLRGWEISESKEGEHLLKHRLNLATPIDAQTFALTKASDEFGEHFASGQYDDCFDAIFQTYLGFVEWNGDVPTRRAWFTPPPKHGHILKLLARMGYLERDGTYVKWTDLAGHAMLCAGAWTPDLQSHAEVKDWQREKEARQIVESLPKNLVFLAMNDPGAAFWEINNRLQGDRWTQQPEKLLVERVIEIIQSKKQL